MTNLHNINDAPNFSLKDLVIDAKVISVYDGDTIKCIFPFKGEFFKWNCRLSGIDTPEIRTKCKKEKEYGYKVRDILRNRILNKVVSLKCGSFDKYGRLLVSVKCIDNECDINKWLIENNYAFEYLGGKKKSWKDHLENTN
tara:strand:+ start:171 stop:593 length:423 start_codon:yes stop_codon:yes gene_type:complete